jgi:xyloglucan-specific endo-beta-1,4-glucanase
MKLFGALACLVVGIAGAITHSEQNRDTGASPALCGIGDTIQAGDFYLRNYWAEGSEGSQCTTLVSAEGSKLSWNAKWSWPSSTPGGSSMVSLILPPGVTQISSFKSIPISWLWSYKHAKGTTANVGYDIFGFGNGPTATNWQLLIWLGSYGMQPSGSKFGTVNLGHVTFDVYTDEILKVKTHFFVARSPQTDFTGDLLDFFNYCVDNLGIDKDYNVYNVQGGTKVYQGLQATFSSSRFSLAPKYKPVPTSSVPPTPSQTGKVCSPQWAQCGGSGWTGPTCCEDGFSCIYLNEFHSQCLADGK